MSEFLFEPKLFAVKRFDLLLYGFLMKHLLLEHHRQTVPFPSEHAHHLGLLVPFLVTLG